MITGTDGLLPALLKEALERGLAAELTDHLGYERGESAPSARPNTTKRECGQDRRPRRWGPSGPVAAHGAGRARSPRGG